MSLSDSKKHELSKSNIQFAWALLAVTAIAFIFSFFTSWLIDVTNFGYDFFIELIPFSLWVTVILLLSKNWIMSQRKIRKDW